MRPSVGQCPHRRAATGDREREYPRRPRKITAVAPSVTREILRIFCDRGCFRLSGEGDDLQGGSLRGIGPMPGGIDGARFCRRHKRPGVSELSSSERAWATTSVVSKVMKPLSRDRQRSDKLVV